MPRCILLVSGKRKSGKDYLTDILKDKVKSSVIIKISAPIKSHFANIYKLNLEDLMSCGDFKEKYREPMIEWSEKVRAEDSGVFCRQAIEMYKAQDHPIWIVSDVRRKSDVAWFKETYPNIVKVIRVEASENVRKSRGWVFNKNVDDAESECDLDDFSDWNLIIKNNNDNDGHFAVSQIISIIGES